MRLLGVFTVELGARALSAKAFPRRKAQQLVKLLALQTGGRMHRDQVVEALWPHLPPEAGAHQLRNALSQARAALRTLAGSEVDPVAVEGGVVALRHPNGVTTDLHHALTTAGLALVDPSLAVLQSALAPLLGTLLPDDIYEPWSEPAREEVHAMALRLRLALAEALLARLLAALPGLVVLAATRQRLGLQGAWVVELGVLSCDEIVAELGRGLDLLVSTTVDVPERHRSLRAAFLHAVVARDIAGLDAGLDGRGDLATVSRQHPIGTRRSERGDVAQAVALCMLTLRTPSAGREARAQAEALMLRLARDLDPAAMAAAQERGNALHLHDLLMGQAPEAPVEHVADAHAT